MDSITNFYSHADTWVHRLDGSVKFLSLIVWSIFIFTFLDIRIFLFMFILGLIILRSAKISKKKILPLFLLILTFTIFNSIFLLLIAPNFGSTLTGTTTDAFSIGYATVTYETIWYILTMTTKYLALFPITLIFIFTTNPSEFASSLSRLEVPYKVSYAVNIALRYIPDIAIDFKNIKNAQMLKGIDFETGNPLTKLKRYMMIIIPLVTTSITRIDSISNGMDLRGFGKHKTRSWYVLKPLTKTDKIGFIVLTITFLLSLYLSVFKEIGFYYPF